MPVPPRKSPEEASTFSDFCQVGFCPRALGMQTGIWWPVCGWPLDTSHLDGQMANVPWSPADWPKAPVQTLPKPTKINIMTGSISLGRKKKIRERDVTFDFPNYVWMEELNLFLPMSLGFELGLYSISISM